VEHGGDFGWRDADRRCRTGRFDGRRANRRDRFRRLDVLRKSISVDVHTHGGKTGITSKAPAER